jgi:hypothetical protein
LPSYQRYALAFAIIVTVFLSTTYADDYSATARVRVLVYGGDQPPDGFVFYVLQRGGIVREITVSNGTLELPISAGYRLVGPAARGEAVYLPVDLPLGPHWIDGHSTIVLERAARIRISDQYPWIDGGPTRASYRVETYTAGGNYSGFFTWPHGPSELKRILGLGEEEILVPLRSEYKLYAKLQARDADGSPIVVEVDLTEKAKELLSLGDSRLSLLPLIFDLALGQVADRLSYTDEALHSLQREGVYLGYQRERLERVRTWMKQAERNAEEGLWAEAYFQLRKAFVEIENIGNVVGAYQGTGERGGLVFPLFLILASLVLTGLIGGEGRTAVLTATALLSGAMLLFITLFYPFLIPRDAWGWAALFYTALVMLGMILGIGSLGVEVKTYRGVALLSAASLAFSLSRRFLRSRPLRTWLMICMASITVAATLLLINSGAEGQIFGSQVIDRVEARGTHYLVLYGVDYRYDNPSDISLDYLPYLRSIGSKESVRAETPIYPPSGVQYLFNGSRYNLRGVIGVGGQPPFLAEVGECLLDGSLSEVGTRDGATIFSRDIAERLGLSVGSKVLVNGVPLMVSGILREECPTYLKDIDGYFASTLVQPPMSPVTPAGWTSILITGVDEALKLGATPTKIYLQPSDDTDPRRFAERVAYQTGLKIRLVTGDGEVYAFSLSRVTGIQGGEVVAVAGIALLNILVTSLANYYERRKEIFTMSTLGLNPAHIVLVSLAEATILAVVSSSIGVVMTLGILAAAPTLAEAAIDFKVNEWTALSMLGYTLAFFSVAHVVSVRRSIILSTPAQEWRWALTKTLDADGYWNVSLPARVRWDRVDRFLTYLISRLNEYSYTTTVKITVREVESAGEGEKRTRLLRFTYSSTEQRPFTSDTVLEVRRIEDKCEINLRCRIEAAHEKFIDQYVREIVQLIRQFIIEFASLTVRILVPVGVRRDHIPPLLNVYAPNELRIVFRGSAREERLEIISEVESRMVRVVPIQLSENNSLVESARALIEAAKECDLLCVSSDDGYLSALVFLTAQKLGKRICIVSGQEVVETTPESVWENFRHTA